MKLTSRQNTQRATVILLLLLALLLWLLLVNNKRRHSSIESGQFEAQYASVMDDLKSGARNLQKKLTDGTARHLAILPEDQIIQPEVPEQTETEPEPDITEEPALGTIHLKGIYWSQSMPLAEINDKLRQPGETVAGYVVEEIQPYQVILVDPDGNHQTNSLINKTLLINVHNSEPQE